MKIFYAGLQIRAVQIRAMRNRASRGMTVLPTYILTLFFFDMKIHLFFRPVFSNPKSIQASVTLLERLAIILDKSTEADMRNLVLPLLFNSLESKMSQIQVRDDMMNSNNLFLIHVLKI